MANKEKNMHQVQEILRRKVQGESDRSIARNTSFSRSTIADYLKIISKCGYDPKQALGGILRFNNCSTVILSISK